MSLLQLQRGLACPTCRAQPGHACETVVGARRIRLPTNHLARSRRYEGYRPGYQDFGQGLYLMGPLGHVILFHRLADFLQVFARCDEEQKQPQRRTLPAIVEVTAMDDRIAI